MQNIKSVCDARKQRSNCLLWCEGKPWVVIKESFGVPEMSKWERGSHIGIHTCKD